MEELLKQILTRLDNLNNDVKDLKPLVGQVKTLQEQVTRIETRIENDVSDKVRALYDGYALRGNQIERLREHLDERFDAVQTDLSYVVGKVAQHERNFLQLKMPQKKPSER